MTDAQEIVSRVAAFFAPRLCAICHAPADRFEKPVARLDRRTWVHVDCYFKGARAR